MVGTSTEFDSILERCRSVLRLKYIDGVERTAEQLFEAEVCLIRELGFEDSLVQFADFGDRLRASGAESHLIGSGASSVIFFLLGMSEVDPVRHRTHFERLWRTAGGEPPFLQFVVRSQDDVDWKQTSTKGVSVHSMTELESIPADLESKLTINSLTDNSTFASLQAGDTDGIFQLESEEIRELLIQIQPTRIKGIAMATALAQIGHANPDVVAECLQRLRDRSALKQMSDRRIDPEKCGLPFLFQETIMQLLRSKAGLSWEETYHFILESAKNRMTDQHELWQPVLEGLARHRRTNAELLIQKLVAASHWAVCRAHHIANAITSYKAAYFRTHHRQDFEQTRHQMIFGE